MTDSPVNGAAISDPDAIRNIIGGFSLCFDVDPVENLKSLLDSHVVIETRGADRVGGTDYVERGLVGYLAKMRRLRDSGKAGPDSLRRHVVVPITVNVAGNSPNTNATQTGERMGSRSVMSPASAAPTVRNPLANNR